MNINEPDNDLNNHTVLWSGGTDSTYALYYAAKEYSTKSNPITAMSIHQTQLGINLLRNEAEARKKILKKMKEDGLHVDHVTVKYKKSSAPMVQGGHGGALPAVWVSNAIIHSPNNSWIWFGYVKGDDYWASHSDFVGAFEKLASVMGKKLKPWFPFNLHDKAYVQEGLDKAGYLGLCWYCDNEAHMKTSPIPTPCGTCICCKAHRTAEWWRKTTKREKHGKTVAGPAKRKKNRKKAAR